MTEEEVAYYMGIHEIMKLLRRIAEKRPDMTITEFLVKSNEFMAEEKK